MTVAALERGRLTAAGRSLAAYAGGVNFAVGGIGAIGNRAWGAGALARRAVSRPAHASIAKNTPKCER
jgi:hypothetical protein